MEITDNTFNISIIVPADTVVMIMLSFIIIASIGVAIYKKQTSQGH